MKYKSEKHLCEELFLLAGLSLLASGAMSDGKHLREKLDDIVFKMIKESGKDLAKLERRASRINWIVGVGDMIKNQTHGHKFILIWHALAELLIERGWKMTQEILDCYEPFLEIESNMVNDDSEWIKLKQSANKQAKKLLNKLNENGFFQ